MKPSLIIVLFSLILGNTSSVLAWQAFNDSANKNGGTDDPSVTDINVGRTSPGPDNGELLVFGTGEGTGVTVRYEETFSTGSVFWTADAIDYDSKSDAAQIFDKALDLTGNISYGDAPGWHMDLIIEGLEPNRTYTFVGTAMRGGGEGYAERTTNWRIMGAEAYTYASSQGAWKVGEDSVEFSTGHNEVGYVARWTGIRPGDDGSITVRTSHTVGEGNGGLPGAHSYKGYAGGAFMLQREEQVESGPTWRAFNDSANKNGGTDDASVTDINVGRTSPGPDNGELLIFGSGEGTGVNVRYEETFSTGSVFWTADAISYDPSSDAAQVFDKALDLTGNISYGDAPGWHMDLIIEGLESNRTYTFVGTAMRGGGEGYAERTTNWRIVGAEAYTYASSQGAWKVDEDSVEFSTGHNEVGYVAKWTGIRSGEDGTITIRTSHTVGEANGGLPGAHSYKGYAGGAFMLELEPQSSGGDQTGKMQIVRLSPAAGLQADPGANISITVDPSEDSIDPDSIRMELDGRSVDTSLIQSGDFVEIRFAPSSDFGSGSTHEVAVSFNDSTPARNEYTADWSFTVIDYSDLPSIGADKKLSDMDLKSDARGFAIRTIATDPENTAAGDWALEFLEDLVLIWNESYENLADLSGVNSKGYFTEQGTVNYQRDQLAIGTHGEEKPFPGIMGTSNLVRDGEENPAIQFGCEITTVLELEAGYHDFAITSAPVHELRIGFGANAAIVEPHPDITPGNSDNQGWRYKFLIEDSGYYPFTLLYFDNLGGSSTLTVSGGSASSLEWLVKASNGTSPLVNSHSEGAIKAYIPAYAFDPADLAPIVLKSVSAQSFRFNAKLGASYDIEGSSDLRSWETLETISASSADQLFEDAAPVRPNAFFYRVKQR